MTTTIRCRAKDPTNCKFHAAGQPTDAAHEALYERLEAAQNAFDFDAYGEAFTELQVLDGIVERVSDEGPLPPVEVQRQEMKSVLDEALSLTGREQAPSRQELAALYARIPNEVIGESILGLLKKYKKNNLAIVDAKNPYMYRVLASNIRQYQPNTKICEAILASGDHRARLLLASHLKNDFRAIQDGSLTILDNLSHDTDPEIREYIAQVEEIYPGKTSTPLTKRLREDPNADVRLALARNRRISLEDAETLVNDTDPRIIEELKPRVERMQAKLREQIADEAAYAAEYKARFEAGQLTEDEIDDLNWEDEHAYFKYYAN